MLTFSSLEHVVHNLLNVNLSSGLVKSRDVADNTGSDDIRELKENTT